MLEVLAGLAVGGIAITVVDLARSRFPQRAELTPYAVRSVTSETAE